MFSFWNVFVSTRGRSRFARTVVSWSIAGGLVCSLCFTPVWAALRGVAGKDTHHVVKSGETLFSIAQDYGLAIEHLAFANGLSTDSIQVPVGKDLLIPRRRVLPKNPPSNGLVINLPERGVFLFRGGKFEKFYPCCIGQPGKFQTPQGTFAIVSLTKDPTWMPPEWANMGEDPVPPGPDNPLGDRWIGLSAPGIGLHSTTSPMSIGQAASHGCMRMYPNSVHDLFDRVDVGWPVRIEYETVKIASDEAKGSCYLAVFPDVYGCQGVKAALKSAMDESGLEFDESDLAELTAPNGVAKELSYTEEVVPVEVEVAGHYAPWNVTPRLMEGTIYGPAQIARAAGLNVNWDAQAKAVEINYGKETLVFPLEESYKINIDKVAPGHTWNIGGYAVSVDGGLIIPLRPVLKKFALGNSWDGSAKLLKISKVAAPKAKAKAPAKPAVTPALPDESAPAESAPAPVEPDTVIPQGWQELPGE